MSTIIISGSIRTGSFHWRLAELAATALRETAKEHYLLPREAHQLPLYDGDLEKNGFPDPVTNLRDVVANHRAIVFTNPEYNGSVSPLLKNIIDWLSRPDAERPGYKLLPGKVAMIVSTSPGSLGGIRAHSHLRDILDSVGIATLPGGLAIPHSATSIDPTLTPELQEKLTRRLSELDSLARVVQP